MKSKITILFTFIFMAIHAFAINWDDVTKIVASDRAANDNFGYSVSISGNFAIVGATFEDEDEAGGNTLTTSGAAYIFYYDGSTWIQEQKLVASDRGADDYFGCSVAISGDYAIVGAAHEDEDETGANTLASSGSAYIFYNNGSTWTQQQKIVASDRGANDGFGISVSISGNYAIVGAFQEDENASNGNTVLNAGSAYIFHYNGSTWMQDQKIVASDRGAEDYFGKSISISNDYAIVGAFQEDEDVMGANTMSYSGSAYIFHNNGSTWTQEQKIIASDRKAGDSFGYSVSISGNYAIAGAHNEDEDASSENTLSNAGSAYIFYNNGSTWTQQQKIVASDREAGDRFGFSVSISGNYAIAGAFQEDDNTIGENTLSSSGSAYIFYKSGSTWTQQEKIVAPDREVDDCFGVSVSIAANIAIVGAFQEGEDAASLSLAGSAYIFDARNFIPCDFNLLWPLNSSQITDLSPEFKWNTSLDNNIDDTVKYTLLLDTPEPGVLEYKVGLDTSFTASDILSDNTSYYWKVIATDLNGATKENTKGNYCFSVNTGNDIPSAALPITPDSVIVLNLNPKFKWEKSIDPDPGDSIYYKMYIENETYRDSIESDSNGCILTNPLVDNSHYHWYVKSMDNHLAFKKSSTVSFWTDLFPEAPEQFNTISPANQDILQTTLVDLCWEKANDPDPLDYARYKIRYKSIHPDSLIWHEIMSDLDTNLTLSLKLNNRYEWQVIAYDQDGFEIISDNSTLMTFDVGTYSGTASQDIPSEFTLNQNYPNPFNPITHLHYGLPEISDTKLIIFNLTGQKIKEWITPKQNVGWHKVTWDGSDMNGNIVPTGIYIYSLHAKDLSTHSEQGFIETKKMVFIK